MTITEACLPGSNKTCFFSASLDRTKKFGGSFFLLWLLMDERLCNIMIRGKLYRFFSKTGFVFFPLEFHVAPRLAAFDP